MPAHPWVLVTVAEKVAQRRDDRVAAGDQRVARRRLQPAVAEQRHQARDEERVDRAKGLDAANRLARHAHVLVGDERHEQRAEPRVLDVCKRGRHFAPSVHSGFAHVAGQRHQRRLCRRGVGCPPGIGQHDRRRRRDARFGIVEVALHRRRDVLTPERGERLNRRRPHVCVIVAKQPLHLGGPAGRRRAPHRIEGPQRPGPHRGRVVPQQEGRDQMAFVEHGEHVDGIEHARLVRARELLHEQFDGRRVCDARRRRRGHERVGLDAAAERLQVFGACAHRRHHPDRRDHQARVAERGPGEVESPRLDQHQDQQGPARFGEAIHRDVDERLRAVLHVGRQRQKQHLPRRLVDRVADRGVEHARHRRRPQRAAREDQRRRPGETDRQDQQRDRQSERAVDLAGERHLHDEADDRKVEADLREEAGNRVGRVGALHRFGRHVQLLVDDRGADRGKPDHDRDELQMARLREQPDRLGAADAGFLATGGRRAVHGLTAYDRGDDPRARGDRHRADEEQVVAADPRHRQRGDGGA